MFARVGSFWDDPSSNFVHVTISRRRFSLASTYTPFFLCCQSNLTPGEKLLIRGIE